MQMLMTSLVVTTISLGAFSPAFAVPTFTEHVPSRLLPILTTRFSSAGSFAFPSEFDQAFALALFTFVCDEAFKPCSAAAIVENAEKTNANATPRISLLGLFGLFAFIADNPSNIGASLLVSSADNRRYIGCRNIDFRVALFVALYDADTILGDVVFTGGYRRGVVGADVDLGIALNSRSFLTGLGASDAK
ncbi:MAG TPA: hypothetical protein VJ001_15085 [Rhodocyclaceae bacterium]|nr:hypothetical protein [Rhodocyclaceae bacterium]